MDRASDGHPLSRRLYPALLAHDLRRGATVHGLGGGEGTWIYGPTAAGEFGLFGAACGGSLGVPWMLPRFGQRPEHRRRLPASAAAAAGRALAFGLFGFSNTNWFGVGPLPYSMAPLGSPGCDLRVEPDFVAVLPLQNGQGDLEPAAAGGPRADRRAVLHPGAGARSDGSRRPGDDGGRCRRRRRAVAPQRRT